MTDENTRNLVVLWAEHAAIPFQGMPKEKIRRQLSIAIGTAISAGSAVIEGLGDVEFAYKWDDQNAITVEIDKSKFTDEMLVIRDSKCR